MESEKRVAPRNAFFRPVQIRLVGGNAISGKSTNISIGGIGLMSSEPLQLNITCLLSFSVDLDGVFQKVNVVAQVCNVSFSGIEGARIGFKFLKFDGNSAEIIKKYLESISTPPGET